MPVISSRKRNFHWIGCGLALVLAGGCVSQEKYHDVQVDRDALKDQVTKAGAERGELKLELEKLTADVEKLKADAETAAKKASQSETQLGEAKLALKNALAEAKMNKLTAEENAAELNRAQASLKNAEAKNAAAQEEAVKLKGNLAVAQSQVDGLFAQKGELERKLDEATKKIATKPTTAPVPAPKPG
jgi:chromosome segregation ATPase